MTFHPPDPAPSGRPAPDMDSGAGSDAGSDTSPLSIVPPDHDTGPLPLIPPVGPPVVPPIDRPGPVPRVPTRTAGDRAHRPPLPPVAPDTPVPVGRVPVGDTALRRGVRAVLGLVTGGVAARELADLAAAVQVPVTTGRRIGVVSTRGGAGRTTVTALLGMVYATRRADHVVVSDADPEPGSLGWRLGLPPTPPLGTLAPGLLAACSGSLDAVDELLPRTPAGLRLLPGAAPGQPSPSGEILRALSRFFAVGVADCGRGLLHQATLDVLAGCHAVVVVSPATPDGLRSTCAALDLLPPGALDHTTLALCTLDRTGRAAITGGAAAMVDRFGVPVVWLPYDRHLAAGAPIGPARLGEGTVVAATRLAAIALDRANRA